MLSDNDQEGILKYIFLTYRYKIQSKNVYMSVSQTVPVSVLDTYVHIAK